MKKIISIWLVGSVFLWANTLVQTYRLHGIDAMERQAEKILQDRNYWKKYLEDKDVIKGYYEFSTPVIFVDKMRKIMELYHYKDFKQKFTSTQDVIVGKMGNKQKEGDLKTPVGVYDITKRFIPKDSFYGPVSFALSYPNVLDKLKQKNGYGIWIHGFPMNNEARDEKTKGCIAVENEILLRFDKELNSDKAIVIISEEGDINVPKSDIEIILSSMFEWLYAWKYSHINKYLSFYGKDFTRYDGKNIKEFSAMKKRIFAKNEKKTIIFKDISISPYPSLNENKLYRINFYEIYESTNYQFMGKKELYVRINDEKMEIIAEQ